MTLSQEGAGGDRGLGEGVTGVGAEREEARSRPVSPPMLNRWGRPESRPWTCMTSGYE